MEHRTGALRDKLRGLMLTLSTAESRFTFARSLVWHGQATAAPLRAVKLLRLCVRQLDAVWAERDNVPASLASEHRAVISLGVLAMSELLLLSAGRACKEDAAFLPEVPVAHLLGTLMQELDSDQLQALADLREELGADVQMPSGLTVADAQALRSLVVLELVFDDVELRASIEAVAAASQEEASYAYSS